MPSKKFWIIAGAVALGAGATAVAAQGFRHAHDRGGYYGGHGEYRHEGRGGRRGWFGRGPVTKEDYDERTRSRFARMDANGDGTVDADEAKGVVERRMERRGRRGMRRGERFAKRMMRRFDADKDGKVTKAEFEGRISEAFARFDLDSDGRITDADLPPMLRDRGFLSGEGRFGRHHRRRGPGRRFMRLLRGADTNNDGMISPEEAQAAASKRFARWDRNKDGAIDKTDLDSFRGEIVDYRVSRFLHRFGASKEGKLTREQFEKFRNERFTRLDANSDGELSRDEMPRKRWRKWRRRGGHHGGHHRGRRHEREYRRGHDGEGFGRRGRDERRL